MLSIIYLEISINYTKAHLSTHLKKYDLKMIIRIEFSFRILLMT